MSIREMKLIDEVEHFLCKKCGEWKPRNQFHKNSRSYWNVHTYCKICLHKYDARSANGTTKEPIRKINDIYDKTTKDGATNVLKNMGYDLQQDVSQQFMERIKERYNIDLN